MTSLDFLICQDRTAFTDTGKLILGGRVFDLENQTESALTRTGDPQGNAGTEMNISCADGMNRQILTASLEKDPETQAFSLQFWKDGVLTGTSSALPDEILWGNKSLKNEAGSGSKNRRCICRAFLKYICRIMPLKRV